MSAELPLLISISVLTSFGVGWLLWASRRSARQDAHELEMEVAVRAAPRGFEVTAVGRGFSLTHQEPNAPVQAIVVCPEVYAAGAQLRAGIVDVWMVRVDAKALPASMSGHLEGQPLIANDRATRDLQGQTLAALLERPANQASPLAAFFTTEEVRRELGLLFALRPVRTFRIDAGVLEVRLERDTKSGREAWQVVKAAERLAIAMGNALEAVPKKTDDLASRPHPQSGQPISTMDGVYSAP